MTIRDVDDLLRRALEAEARARGTSLNRTVLTLLRKATGLEPDAGGPPREFDDLDPLAGTWSQAEADEFERVLAEQRVIEEQLWPPTP